MKRGALIVVLAIAAMWAARVDVPRLTGPVKGDEATYVSMALSLANDRDLKYRPEDYRRFVQLYGTGPGGIFLKETMRLDWRIRAGWPPITIARTPIPTSVELDYGKPFAYAVAAAPFAAAFGLGGLLLFNVLLIGVCVWCAVRFCQARAGRAAGTAMGVSFVLASVVPAYVAWLTPEIFNFTLVLVAYFLWLYKEVAPADTPAWLRRPGVNWVAALLLGVATFSKVSNGFLILPLVLLAIRRRQWRSAALVSGIFWFATLGLFGVNEMVAGDWNYQGGHRNTFASHFPFDDAATTFESGNPMTTNEANDQSILAPDFLWPMLRYNVWYFVLGRDAGLVPYYFPGVLIAVLWLVRARRSLDWQAFLAVGAGLSILALLILAPESWNGGGGPIGNRYFLSIYPALLFLMPAATGLAWAIAAAVGGWLFVGAILLHPFSASQEPWTNPERWPLRLLPVELTLIEDLPVRLKIERARVEVSKDPEVFLYYMDGRTYYQEPSGGFWVAPGTTDIVIRTERPLTLLTLQLTSRVPNEIKISIGGRSDSVTLRPKETSTLRLHPASGVFARHSYQILLTITTAAGFHPRDVEPSTDTRYLGVFLKPTFEVK
jgi:hypothetical protein